MDRISGDMTWWMFFPGKEYPESYHMHFVEHPFYLAQLNNWKEGKKYSVIEVSGEEKNSYDKYTFGQTEFKNIPIESQQFMMSFEKIMFSNAYMKHGAFSWGVEQIDDEHASVLQRFASVFEQCYTRFLDLQKAEAQAREAQIETALERVRSRSLAMHKSEELEDVILVVSEQLQQLQFKFNNVSFGFDTEQMGLNFWLASPQLSRPFLIKVPYIDNPAFNRPIQSRKNGADFCADILSREENLQFLQHMFDYSDLNHIPTESKSFLLSTPGFARSQSLMKNTILTVGNYFPTPYSQEQNAILKRFGNVFE